MPGDRSRRTAVPVRRSIFRVASGPSVRPWQAAPTGSEPCPTRRSGPPRPDRILARLPRGAGTRPRAATDRAPPAAAFRRQRRLRPPGADRLPAGLKWSPPPPHRAAGSRPRTPPSRTRPARRPTARPSAAATPAPGRPAALAGRGRGGRRPRHRRGGLVRRPGGSGGARPARAACQPGRAAAHVAAPPASVPTTPTTAPVTAVLVASSAGRRPTGSAHRRRSASGPPAAPAGSRSGSPARTGPVMFTGDIPPGQSRSSTGRSGCGWGTRASIAVTVNGTSISLPGLRPASRTTCSSPDARSSPNRPSVAGRMAGVRVGHAPPPPLRALDDLGTPADR